MRNRYRLEASDMPNDETMSMCLIGKLWTTRSYNSFGMVDTMKKLWNPTRGMICRDLGFNLMAFQFIAIRDMKKVLEMEPWHFNKHVLVLKKITDEIQPSAMVFVTTPFWLRIYDLPQVGRNEGTLRQIGTKFGEFIKLDVNTITGITRSVRMKVRINLGKPLKRGTRIRIGNVEPCWLPVTYERLPSFCYWCGLLGHTHKDCSNVQDKEEQGEVKTDSDLPYGEWMGASPMKWSKVML